MGQAISLVRLLFARLLGEKSAYVFPLVRVEFGRFSVLSKLSGELSELDFSLLREDVTDLLHWNGFSLIDSYFSSQTKTEIFFVLLLLYFSTEVCIRVCILSVVSVVGQAGFICFVEFVLFCIFGGKHERKASIRLDLLNYSPGFTPLWRCSLNWCFPGKLEQKAKMEQFLLFHAAFSDFPWWTEETP